MQASHKKAVRSAFGFSLIHRYGEAVLRIAVLMVLARLIEPDGFGAFAVALALATLLANACREGVIAWIVNTEDRAERPFGLGAAALIVTGGSALCGAGLWVFSTEIAAATGIPEAATSFRILSGIFVFLPMTALFSGLLRRQLQFGRVALVGLLSVVAGAAVSVALALAGFDQAALAGGMLAESVVIAAGSVAAARGGIGLLRRRGAPVREVALFCVNVSGGNLLSNLGKTAATLATAKFLGPVATGLYDRARRVTLTFGDLVMKVVSPVVLPALADAKRRGEGFAEAYLFKTKALSLAAWPFFAVLAVAAEPVVLLLLGPDWTQAIPLVQIACLFGLPLPFHATDVSFLVASGRERTYLRIQAVTQALTLIMVVAAAQVSVAMVLLAYSGGKIIKAVMTTWVLNRALGVSLKDVLAATSKSFVVTVGVAFIAWAVIALAPAPSGLIEALGVTASVGIACAAGLIGLSVLIDHPVRGEAEAALQHGWETIARRRRA